MELIRCSLIYTACFDVALGLSGSVLGIVASHAGLSAAFLVSALVALSTAAVAVRLLDAGGAQT
jgi:predicted MFS family arabinose efflux permease